MESTASWKQIKRNVSAVLELSCDGIGAEEITRLLGVKPTESDLVDLPVAFTPGGVVGGKSVGIWTYATSAYVSSANISDHVRHLARTFLPLKSRIEEMRPVPRISVRIGWEANPGLGFQYLANDCVVALAQLNAGLKIDPVCREEPSNA